VSVTYARSGDAHIAYRTYGEGPVDLVYFSPIFASFQDYDDEPHTARFGRRLAAFARVIEFDLRGTGMSDRGELSDERLVEDTFAVLDAIGSSQAVLFASSGSGGIAIECAVRAPERVHSLVLFNSYARLMWADDYPHGLPGDFVQSFLDDNTNPEAEWSSEGDDDVDLLAPSLTNDPRFRSWLQRSAQRAASPAEARNFLRLSTGVDVRRLLSDVSVPTLVIARANDRFLPAATFGRYLAERIPGARLVELPGADHLPFAGDADALLDEVEEFVTGRRSGSADRVLATVLFTDIVDSTRRATELGDAAWRAELDGHDAIVRTQLGRFGGREVNTTGDGFVAAFDIPTSALACARAIAATAATAGLRVRLGVHTGECERRGDDLAGLTVHIAARVAAVGDAGEIVASRTVCDLLAGSELRFRSLGEHDLKGVARPWELFALEP
jgi:pimeloyl-ACP methyl ester carboxylesterase